MQIADTNNNTNSSSNNNNIWQRNLPLMLSGPLSMEQLVDVLRYKPEGRWFESR
jgi:hypothetical protein